jgi:peptide chain release factor 2
MINQEQIKEIQNRLETLKECLNITNKRKEVEELTEKTLHPDFWNFPKCAEITLKKKSKIEFWIKSMIDLYLLWMIY